MQRVVRPVPVVLVATLTLGPSALAAPVEQVVSYTGHLDLDGAPVDEVVQLRFSLYDTPAGQNADGAPWSECHPAVRVRNGAFTVRLGAPTGPGAEPVDVTPWLVRNVQTYVEIAVRRPDAVANPAGDCSPAGGEWTTFPTRQRLTPTPHALTSVVTVPPGAVMNFALPFCPAGWFEYEPARGRYIVGLQPGGALGATQGQALGPQEDRPVGAHAHGIWDPGHGHAISDPGHTHGIPTASSDGNGGTNDYGNNYVRDHETRRAWTGITINAAGTGVQVLGAGNVAGTPAPYIQLLTCIKQ
jgi:hypothetical protein